MMFFPTAVLALLFGLCQATEFTVDSAVGRRILQKARTVKESRHLQDGNGKYFDLGSMTIRYMGCSSYNKYANDRNWQYGNGQQEQQQDAANEDEAENNYWKYQDMAQNDGLQPSNLVRFTLCTGSGCSACDGEYVLDMEDFMESYTEWKMSHDSFWCERVRERCICNTYNYAGSYYTWRECYSSCFEQAPYDLTYQGCLEANANGKENVFQIQQYFQCKGISFYNPYYASRNQSYTGQFSWRNYFYLGLTCDNHANVVLKAFYDYQCSYRVKDSEVLAAMGSYNDIPYLQGTPVLAKGTCIACIADEDAAKIEESSQNYNYNNGGSGWVEQPDANDICSIITGDDAIVCDESRYRTNDCAWLQDTLPSLDGRFKINYSEQYAKLTSQLGRSEVKKWALFGTVVALIGILSVWGGYKLATWTSFGCDYGCDSPRGDHLLPERHDDSRDSSQANLISSPAQLA